MKLFKYCFWILLLYLSIQESFAQRGVYGTISKENFSDVPTISIAHIVSSPSDIIENIEKATFFIPDQIVMDDIMRRKPRLLSLEVPSDVQGLSYVLLLKKIQSLTPDFICKTTSGKIYTIEDIPENVQYMGVIKGLESESLVAISFSEGQIFGILCNLENGNMTLGKLDKDDTHVIYAEKNYNVLQHKLFNQTTIPCVSNETGSVALKRSQTSVFSERNEEKCVRQFVEVDVSIYDHFNQDIVQTLNFVIGLFNVSSVLYFNDGMNMVVSEIVVNTTPVYSVHYLQEFLNRIQNYYNGQFNGDIAQLVLLSKTGNVGGFATAIYGNFCEQKEEAACYSEVNPFYQQLPSYSKSVQVVTHETGHILGSHHSHECYWNNNNTAMDNCSGTTCYTGTLPLATGSGTIMSYCDPTPGVNLMNGFGNGSGQPAELLRTIINNSECLTSCCVHTWDSYDELLTTTITQREKHAALVKVVGRNVVAHKNDTVLYRAGDRVVLEPGFRTDISSPAIFVADIGSCDPISVYEDYVPEKMNNDLAVYKTYGIANDISVFPNPSQSNITIRSKTELGYIFVYDILGKKVLEQDGLGLYSVMLNVNALSSGLYYLRVVSVSGGITNLKISKL